MADADQSPDTQQPPEAVALTEADPQYRFNHFDASAVALIEQWSKAPHAPDHVWTRNGPNRTTESSAFDVLDQRMLRATAKPGCKLNHVRHAAHEKIASDLAVLLDLPIPPVTLYHLPGALPDCPHKKKPGDPYVAISAWPFLSFEEWGDRILNKMTPAQKESLRAPISAMWVFDSWISAQEDRGAKHTLVNNLLGNNLVGLAFIDYAFSLSKFWTTDNSPQVAAPWWFPNIQKDDTVVRYVADKLHGLGDADVAHVVNRVPAEWLPDGPKPVIVNNLVSRKAGIHKLLGL
jgi:hypothetical protein